LICSEFLTQEKQLGGFCTKGNEKLQNCVNSERIYGHEQRNSISLVPSTFESISVVEAKDRQKQNKENFAQDLEMFIKVRNKGEMSCP